VAVVAVLAFLQLCHMERLRFAIAGMESEDVREFVRTNTLLIRQTLVHATRSLTRIATTTMLEVDFKDCTPDSRCMAAGILNRKSAFAGKAVTLCPVDK
jgi:hypothetical protein